MIDGVLRLLAAEQDTVQIQKFWYTYLVFKFREVLTVLNSKKNLHGKENAMQGTACLRAVIWIAARVTSLQRLSSVAQTRSTWKYIILRVEESGQNNSTRPQKKLCTGYRRDASSRSSKCSNWRSRMQQVWLLFRGTEFVRHGVGFICFSGRAPGPKENEARLNASVERHR